MSSADHPWRVTVSTTGFLVTESTIFLGGSAMIKRELRFRIAMLGCGIPLLALALGCGGGGGGGGDDLGYAGNREAAVVSSDNARELAASAYDGSSLEGPFGGIASLTDSPATPAPAPSGRPVLLAVYRALVRGIVAADADAAADAVAGADMDAGATAAATATPARSLDSVQGTVNGECGGSFSTDLQFDRNTGFISGAFTYADYCEADTLFNGRAVIRGRLDPDTGELDYIDFTISGLSGTRDGEGFRLDGSVRLTALEATNSNTNTNQVRMDLLFEDLASGETLWLNGFVISVTEGEDYEEVAFSGRIYHSVHGYVDLSTEVPFRFEEDEDTPSEGVLLLTGADNGKILMTVISESHYQVEADTDGDDLYDWGPETCAWDQ
jgi:hypothetical protein